MQPHNRRKLSSVSNPNYKHGASQSAEYRHWIYMKSRCVKDAHYVKHGITVCQEWVNDFARFYADVGPKPFKRATLDRIDGTRGYEPGNVRWATYSEQNRNIVYKSARAKPRHDLAEKLGVHINTLLYREKHGIAVSAPKYGEHTHCRNGHEYSDANTYTNPRGVRKCRICMAVSRKKWKAALRGLNKTAQ